MQILRSDPRPTESEMVGVGPRDLHLNNPPGDCDAFMLGPPSDSTAAPKSTTKSDPVIVFLPNSSELPAQISLEQSFHPAKERSQRQAGSH